MKSDISIIIPTYNRPKYLLDVLESVRQQTRKPYEVIVVDDGSTDNTRKILINSPYKIHYIYQKNCGPAAARNAGIMAAQGDVVAFLDDDDLLLPQALELAAQRLENMSILQVDIVFGLIMRVKNVKKVKRKFTYEQLPPVLTERMIGSSIIRKKVFDRVGLFDESLILGQDLDWYMRAREKHVSFSSIDQVTYLYRIHENNRTNNKYRTNKYLLKILKKSLTRREKEAEGIAPPLEEISDLHS